MQMLRFNSLVLNKGIQSYSHNNIFFQNNLLINLINPINPIINNNQQRLSLVKVTRLPDDSKIDLNPNNPNKLNQNNQNILNNCFNNF